MIFHYAKNYNSKFTSLKLPLNEITFILNEDLSVTECKVTNEAGDKEVYLIHSFEDNESCFEKAISVVQSSWSPNLVFDFRSFRFTTDGTSGDSETQNQNVNCSLHLIPADQQTEEQAKECSCHSQTHCASENDTDSTV